MLLSPLEGVKVLDFTRHLAGPYATMVLADYGADVIKVESIPNGDPSRSLRFKGEIDDGLSAVFRSWNHGKRSIAIDMSRPEGVDAILRLSAEADVVVENYRPGVAASIGIGYEQLAETNPGLVYCSISAYGQVGPWSDQPATDPAIQALSGLMYMTGFEEAPVRVGVPMADYVGGMACVQGVLFALLARSKSGRGQWVDVSLLHALVASFTTRLAEFDATGIEPGRHGTAHSLVVPYEVFETSDGQVIAGTWSQDSWPKFCEALGRVDLRDDPRFRTNRDRLANKALLIKIISDEMRGRTTSEWQSRFHAAKALFAPLLTLSGALSHAQMEQRPAVLEVESTSGQTMLIPNPASVVLLHDTPGRVSGLAPELGEHSIEVLLESGLSSEEVHRLLDLGVLLTP